VSALTDQARRLLAQIKEEEAALGRGENKISQSEIYAR
jgi:hypothetical protein